MRKLDKDRTDWADGTIGELALRAREDGTNHNALATRLNDLLLESSVPSMAVHSFISSINMNMRIAQRLAKNPAAYERMSAQKLIDILCADMLPNKLQLRGIGRTMQLDVAKLDELERVLDTLTREQTPPKPSSFVAALEQQSEIVAFGAEQRERLRRMAGASSSVSGLATA